MIFPENFWRFKEKILKIITVNKIEINDEINFGSKKANKFLIKEIHKSKFYFEYGSGSSTLYLDKNRINFISIESDFSFFKIMLSKVIKKSSIKFFSLGLVGEFSYPIVTSKKKIKNYVESIDKYFKKKKNPDLILIDGRFRVACCLNLLKHKKIKKNKILIVLDDYKKRKDYKILKKNFKIKIIGRLGILKPKNLINIKKKYVEKYYFKSN